MTRLQRQRFALTFAATCLVGALFLAPAPRPAPAAVPKPSDMAVDLVVSGRTTTARNVAVARANEVPATFASTRIGNTPGFSWWVSRHYALKTDYPEAKARFYLTLLEMAYPHYVEAFGRRIPGIDEKRLPVCYASSTEKLGVALKSDGIKWGIQAGGITFEGFKCAYMYPSGTLDYHQRYIVLHECAHLYQLCLAGSSYTVPEWYTEGVADSLASHVYDRGGLRLTVHVFDKPATHDYFDEGMIALARRPMTAHEIHNQPSVPRGVSFLLAHFFLDDPDRSPKFRVYRDEMFRLNRESNRAASDRLLQELFGPWEKIDAAFRAYLAGRRQTFHYAEWGWEQDADTLWSYGFAKHAQLSETDAYLPPGETPAYQPWRMDYPLQPMSPLVGPVERGAAEPSVGCLIDFSRCPGRGRAGIGLGLVGTADLQPIPGGVLFVDEAAGKPGVKVAAYRLDKTAGEGLKPDDVKNGARLGESVDASVALELPRSITQGLKNNFVVEWDGWLRAAHEDLYTFSTTSDDGSWLWVDGNLVVDNGGLHNAQETTGSVRLAAGMHRLRIRYFQAEGARAFDAAMRFGGRPGCLKLLIEEGARLVMDGTDLGLEKKAAPIPQNVRDAMAAGGHRVGLTARIATAALEVTLRAAGPMAGTPAEFKASLPLAEAVRARLLAHPLAILARDGWHGVTPYLDDRRRPEPDLRVPAPPNRWRNPGDHQLEALYRAAWRLKDKAPPSLTALKEKMLAAADKGPEAQKAALAAFEQSLAGVIGDVEQCAAPAEAKSSAVADLRRGVNAPSNLGG